MDYSRCKSYNHHLSMGPQEKDTHYHSNYKIQLKDTDKVAELLLAAQGPRQEGGALLTPTRWGPGRCNEPS